MAPHHARAAPRRPASARAASPNTEDSGGTAGAPVQVEPQKPDWMPASAVGKDFGDPPPPRLQFLQHRVIAWQREMPNANILGTIVNGREKANYRVEDCVKLKEGVTETNEKGRPGRPRSAVVLRKELADLRARPRALQESEPEAVYLLHCDSTNTTLARGRDYWVTERQIEPRPVGLGRDFCDPDGRPRFTKKYGGRVGLLFDDILEEHTREMATAARAPPELPGHALPRRPPASESSASPRARAPPEAALLEDVPPLRRRKQCPPQMRTRVSPRRPLPEYSSRNLVFSLESPRAMTSPPLAGGPPPRRRATVSSVADD